MLKRNTELATSSATSAKTVYSSTRSRGPTARTYFCFRGGCRAPATESVVELDMDNFFPRERGLPEKLRLVRHYPRSISLPQCEAARRTARSPNGDRFQRTGQEKPRGWRGH